jgi:hypothetical protein
VVHNILLIISGQLMVAVGTVVVAAVGTVVVAAVGTVNRCLGHKRTLQLAVVRPQLILGESIEQLGLWDIVTTPRLQEPFPTVKLHTHTCPYFTLQCGIRSIAITGDRWNTAGFPIATERVLHTLQHGTFPIVTERATLHCANLELR